jgi:hypothetical protein
VTELYKDSVSLETAKVLPHHDTREQVEDIERSCWKQQNLYHLMIHVNS